MDYNDINEKIKEITIEDYIWFIYLGIIILSWYSNNLEKAYFINNDQPCKEKYREIIIIIFTILLIVYCYFFKSSLKSLYNLKRNDNPKKRKLTELSSFASLLIVVSGIIYLYIAYMDTNIDVEIAFN